MELNSFFQRILVDIKAIQLLDQKDPKHLELHLGIMNEHLGQGREFGFRKLTRVEVEDLAREIARNPHTVWSVVMQGLKPCGINTTELLKAWPKSQVGQP